MQQDACCRWYLNFNGDECRNPATIELVVYLVVYAQNSQSFHHAIDSKYTTLYMSVYFSYISSTETTEIE